MTWTERVAAVLGWFTRLMAALPPRISLLMIAVLVTGALSRWPREASWRVEGLPEPRRPITVAVVDPVSFSERLRKVQVPNAEELRCRRLGMMELGLVSSAEPQGSLLPVSFWETMRGDEASPAFYVVGSDTVFTITEHNPTIHHEMVHAVEDQVSDRMQNAAAAHTTDEQAALRAVIEGTAILMSRGNTPPLVFNRDIDYNAQVLAYVHGPAYLRQTAMSQKFEDLIAVRPGSTYEVVFGRTRGVPAPVSAPTLAQGERVLCTDQLGPLGIIAAFSLGSTPSSKGMRAVQGWMADRMDVIADGQGRRVVWSVVFGDPESAATWRAGPAFQIPLTSPRVHIDTRTTGMATPGAASPQSKPSPFESLGR